MTDHKHSEKNKIVQQGRQQIRELEEANQKIKEQKESMEKERNLRE